MSDANPIRKRAPIKPLPPQDHLHRCFDYNQDNGEATWLVRPREHFSTAHAWASSNTQFAGKPVGHIDNRGYIRTILDGEKYLVHRLIWKWMTGDDPPPSGPDHIDGNRANNRWANLRVATLQQQQWNVGLKKTNTTGYVGVCLHRGREWRVKFKVDGKDRWFGGRFNTREEAGAFADAIRRELYGEFYREGE